LLPLLKINGASPNLDFYLEAVECEVPERICIAHELETMSKLKDTYEEWRHLINDTRLQSIRLFSVENRRRRYKYDRRIELQCQRGDLSEATCKEQEELLASWVFKSGMFKHPTLHTEYRVGRNLMVWTSKYFDKHFVIDFTEHRAQYIVKGYRLEQDSKSELGYRTLRNDEDDDKYEEED
jgi:hypothetical protein